MLAVLAWTGIWYLGNGILDAASARASTASSAQVQSDRAAYTQRIAALVADTRDDRATLENASEMHIVSIVTMIENIGTKTGITVKVNNAQSQGSAPELPGGGSLNAFALAIEADGSFAQIMRTVQALESLPLPSSIEQLEISLNGGDPGKSHGWHLNARVNVFTASTAS